MAKQKTHKRTIRIDSSNPEITFRLIQLYDKSYQMEIRVDEK